MDKDDKTKAIDSVHADVIGGYTEEDAVAHDTSDTIHAVIDNNVFVNDDGSLAIVEPIDDTTVYGPPSWFDPYDPANPNNILPEPIDPIITDPIGPLDPDDPSLLDITGGTGEALDGPVIGDDMMTE